MKISLINFLIKKLDLQDKDAMDPQVRARYGYLEGWVSVSVNFLLFTAKIIIGVISGSISIIADAMHTVSDVATSGVVIWGFKIAEKPADKEHPFGHGRMENIAALIVAVLVCVVGLEILQEASVRIVHPSEVKTNGVMLLILIISALAKEWLARFSFTLAKRIDSPILNADGWHHRGDAVSTILVIGAVIGAMFKLFILDAVFGIMVAGYIIYTGFRIVRESIVYLLGKRADDQLYNKIYMIAEAVDGVEGVHDIVVHDYGTHKAISLHVEVARGLDSENAHRIATTVETRLAKKIISSPIVHIDLKKKKQQKRKVSPQKGVIKNIIKKYPEILQFHGVQICSSESGDFLNLHIVIPKIINVEQSHELEHELKEELNTKFKEYLINIHIEPCDSKCALCPQDCKLAEEGL
ncbi:MAG: cation transporter [PVC group bacterium]|nr:cation transporter [PVC group bacterium]